MQLLLFLSAILTALTGAVTGTRAVEPQQVSSSVAAVAQIAVVVAAKPVSVANRPAVALVLSRVESIAAFTISAPVPLYASRRRE